MDCENTASCADDAEYDHEPAGLFGADFLWTIGSALRLGPGIQFGTTGEVEFDGADGTDEFGSDLSINFVLEGMFEVGDGVWLGPRGQLGLLMLFPSGDLEDALDSVKDSCEAADISGCDNLEGPRVGVNAAIGGGVMFAVGESVRLRVDLMIQAYQISLYTLEGNGSTVTEELTGSRTYLLGGIEF